MAGRPGGPAEVANGSGEKLYPGDTLIDPATGDTVGRVGPDGRVYTSGDSVIQPSLPPGMTREGGRIGGDLNAQYPSMLDGNGNDARGQYVGDTYYGPGVTPPNGTPTPAVGGPGAVAAPVDPLAAQRAEDRAREQRDAFVRLSSVLEEYGLGDPALLDEIRGWLVGGLSEAEITQRLRDTDSFKKRFPAIEARRKAGKSPLSPAEYVAYEKQAKQMFRAAGLPQGFYDSNDDFTKFLIADVSTVELSDRVGLASEAAFNADTAVRTALADFGITGGDLTAFFLDPDVAQPLLERKYRSARVSATGGRSGFGFLSESEATGLVQAGVSEGQASQGFSDLTATQELYQPIDLGEDVITRDEQLGATFTGNGNARRRIAQRQRRRQSVFEGGGAFAAGERGVVGLGDSEGASSR